MLTNGSEHQQPAKLRAIGLLDAVGPVFTAEALGVRIIDAAEFRLLVEQGPDAIALPDADPAPEEAGAAPDGEPTETAPPAPKRPRKRKAAAPADPASATGADAEPGDPATTP